MAQFKGLIVVGSLDVMLLEEAYANHRGRHSMHQSLICFRSALFLLFLLRVPQFKGRIVTESLDIMLLIEEAYPNHKPLLPSDAEGRRRVQQLLRLERQLMGAWLQYGKAPARGKGAGAWFGGGGGGAQETFESVMVQVDEAIAQSGGPYFLGAEVRLAPCLSFSGIRVFFGTLCL